MLYYFSRYINSIDTLFRVEELDTDQKKHIFVFYCKVDKAQYIGTVRYSTKNKFWAILDDYTLESPVSDFRELVIHFFSDIYPQQEKESENGNSLHSNL